MSSENLENGGLGAIPASAMPIEEVAKYPLPRKLADRVFMEERMRDFFTHNL